MHDKQHNTRSAIPSLGLDAPLQGLAILIAVTLLVAGIVEFVVRLPRSEPIQPSEFVYTNVKVSAPIVRIRGRVNVNTATVAELVRLDGIGEALAGRIVAHRSEHGPFATLDELTAVSGIGPATVDGFREDACCGDCGNADGS